MSTPAGNSRGPAPWRDRRAILVAAPLALLLLLLVVWAVSRGGDDTETGEPAEGAEGTGQTVVTPSPGVDASGSPIPSRSPGQTAPAPAETPKKAERQGTVRTDLQDPAPLGNGVAVEVTQIESVRGEARGPGETAGPALRFTLEVTNDSDDEVNLSATAVTAYSGSDDAPAGDLSGPGVRPFTGTLAQGDVARGVYVFEVPPGQRDQVTVEFSYGAEAPRAVFSGSAA